MAHDSARPLLVAGLGASAGGLDAMLSMFAHIQPTGRIAYVVAQHMANNGHSELIVRLIQRESALPVVLAVDGMKLAADTVYVIPAGKDGAVRGENLIVSAPAPEHLSTPSVNKLFISIAERGGKQAIGIVLSGAGSDGSVGCRAIRMAGGMTLAQDPSEAKFDGMPSAAIDAGVIDQILAAEKMGEFLAKRFPGQSATTLLASSVVACEETIRTAAPANGLLPADTASRELENIVRQILDATGIDFSSYKEETLLRRLEKRKQALGVTSAEAYQTLICRQPEELRTLQNLFLVSVSSFFRDRMSFGVLQRTLAMDLVVKPVEEPVQVWVPGCASGEEPYTLAIILRELLGERHQRHPVMITATDINPEALAIAAEGIYRQTAFREMDDRLLERYFLPKGQHFKVRPELKSCIEFVQRDVLGSTPLRDLDLVSCRNLLIYMKSNLQDRLINTFFQALRPQGLLFIGQSESLGFEGNSRFLPIDYYHRLYRRCA